MSVGHKVDTVAADIEWALAGAGVDACIHAREIAGSAEFGYQADSPVVLASVFKVPVLVELARQFESGRLDPLERLRVPAEGRTGGGTGLSGLKDEVEISLRDLAQLMISVSDNAATDILVEKVGLDNVNRTLDELGLAGTHLEGDCKFLLTRLVQDLRLTEQELEGDEEAVLSALPLERYELCRDLVPSTTNRSTPREMTRLLELTWTDGAGPAAACDFARGILAQQVWPHRLKAGFLGDVKISGKTGTLPLVRNEVGVLEYRDGVRIAVAVFTRAADPALHHPNRDRVIGTVGRAAADAVRAALGRPAGPTP